jgi:putative membrane protein
LEPTPSPEEETVEVFLLHTFLMSLLLLVVAKLVPGITVESYKESLLAALVLGVFNALVRPILVFLTLPVTILTLGFFLVVINALMLRLTSAVVPGFEVKGFIPALLGAVLLAVMSFGITLIF